VRAVAFSTAGDKVGIVLSTTFIGVYLLSATDGTTVS
jgi:hypothetical protein